MSVISTAFAKRVSFPLEPEIGKDSRYVFCCRLEKFQYICKLRFVLPQLKLSFFIFLLD